MSIRPEQPEPFLRGCVFPAVTDAPYPRADPANAEYLPADVWDAAQLPVGVRLELFGGARTVRVWYKTTRASLGYRGESAGCAFVAYRGGQKVATADALMGEGMAELVMSGRTDTPVTVYLPEGMRPLITGVAGVEETMTPAPLQPRWLAYGDAVTQGWLASAPSMAWPAVAGRKLGLDVCNLGYAGTARGETTSALMMAETPAELISIAFGLNNWSRVPHTTGLLKEEVHCFLSVIRNGHPDVPIVVVSPTARPDAEDTPNRVGATLAELRSAMEETVRESISAGDEKLFLVEGLTVVGPEDLADGIYPGDEGHRRLAAAVAKVIAPHLPDLQMAAEKRWAGEGVFSSPTSTTLSPPAPPIPDGVPPHGVSPNGVSPNGVSPNGVSANGVSANGVSANGSANAPSVPPINFDLLDIESLDRDSLNDALLDALPPNGSSPTASPTNGTVPHGSVPAGPSPHEAAPTAGVADEPVPDGLTEDELSPGIVPPGTFLTDEQLASLDDAFSDPSFFTLDPSGSSESPDDSDPFVLPFPSDDDEPVDSPSLDPLPIDPAAFDPTAFDPAAYDPDSCDPDSYDPDAFFDAEMVDSAPVEVAEPVEVVEPVDVASGSAATAPTQLPSPDDPQGSGPTPTPPVPPRTPESKTPPRRDATPVDIEIADMVVAALTLATNGADDLIVSRDPSPTDEIVWLADSDPTVPELRWEDPSPTDQLVWADPPQPDDLDWASVPEAQPTDQLQWSTAEPQ